MGTHLITTDDIDVLVTVDKTGITDGDILKYDDTTPIPVLKASKIIKEAWVDVKNTDGVFGLYHTRTRAPGGNTFFSWGVPSDYISLISCDLIYIPSATETDDEIRLKTTFATTNEQGDNHALQPDDIVLSHTANEMSKASLIDGLDDGGTNIIDAYDVVGFNIDNRTDLAGNTTTLEVLGLYIKYYSK